MVELRTPRLLLRRWQDSDREPFARMNADSEVMEFFPAPLTRGQSDDMVDRIEQVFDERGYSLWALEDLATGEFLGFTGLAPVRTTLPCAPAVEVGWRLALQAWGRGLASEAAAAACTYGFEMGLDEIVSFTAAINTRSRSVMERIGMTRDGAGDFDHPVVPEGNPLRPHVLYRLTPSPA